MVGRPLALAVVALAALAVPAAAETGWAVTTPAGWTEDPAAAKELHERMSGLGPSRELHVYRAPPVPGAAAGRLDLIFAQTKATPEAEALLDRWAEILAPDVRRTTRVTDGHIVVEGESLLPDGQDLRVRVHGVAREGVLHVLLAACSEPRGGTACPPALASIEVGDPEEGVRWAYWIAIAGALLVSLALVGWRLELRRR